MPAPEPVEGEASFWAGLEPLSPVQHPNSGTDEYVVSERPAVARRPDDAPNRAPSPFVWQLGTQLILLDDDPSGWVMAELRFDDQLCRYCEVRRAVYTETREAIGAVLSRALASGYDAAVDNALSLHEWLHTYYGIVIVEDLIKRPDENSVEFTL